MAAETQPVRSTDVERAIEVVRAHPGLGVLGALSFDVLSRQAEGKTFFAGAKFVEARAEEHGVTRPAAATDAGNLLSILERGPESALERALVVAFAVSGLGARLSAEVAGEDDERRVWRFVRHADWLEVSTDYAVYPFVDGLLDEAQAARVWREVAQAVVDEAAGRDGARPEVRARNAARLSALSASSAPAAGDALRTVVVSTALDEPTRLLASTLAGDGADAAGAVPARIEGQLGRAPRSGAVEVVRWISGWALAAWTLRALGWLLGMRRRADVRLTDRSLHVRTSTSLLGRVVSEREETWRVDALERASRQVRYPSLHLLLGTVALSLGVLFGGLVFFDGVRSGELVLISIAAGLLLVGAGLDLALDVLVPGSRGRVAVDLRQRAGGPLRVTRVPLEQADAFLRVLRSSGERAR